MTVKHLSTDGDLHPLYCRYHGQSDPQPAYIEVDFDDGEVSAGYSGDVHSVPACLWLGHAAQFTVSRNLTAGEVNDLMDEVLPLAERLAALHEIVWDGSNRRGRYVDQDQNGEPESARLAEQICSICSSRLTSGFGVRDAAEWFEATRQDGGNWIIDDECGAGIIMISASTTDAEIEEIARRLEKSANDDGGTIVNTECFLEDLRERCDHE